MLRKLYDWAMGLAASRHAPVSLFAVAFAESSFFPVPPDIMLAPMVLAKPQRAFVYAGICTLGSVIGGLLGYAIGFYLAPVAQHLLTLFGHPNAEAEFQALFAKVGLWIILIKGLTPIPYKLVTIASGFAGYNLFLFVVLSAITRGVRFGIVAGLLAYFGDPIRNFIEKRLEYVMLGFLAVIILGFVIARYIV